MKILYLTYDGLSDPLGQSQILPYIRGLNKLGHRITIVSSEKKEKTELVSSISKKLAEEGIHWKNISYTKSPPILSTIFDVFRMRKYCMRLLEKENFDIVHCRSYITSLIGEYLKRKKGLRFIFDMRGFYADERIDGEIWNQHKLIYKIVYRFFKRKESGFLQHSDYTICLTEAAKAEIHSWRNIPTQPRPIKVIPCCVDTTVFNPAAVPAAQREALLRELKIEQEDLVLSYQGAVGTWYMLDEMLDFFKEMLQRFPKSKFLFITQDSTDKILDKTHERQIAEDRIIIRNANHQEVPALLSLSKISIFFIKPVYSKMASSPAKMGEILSMGIPILCNSDVGDTSKIIASTKTGAILQSFTAADYQALIDEIPNLLSLPKEQIQAVARDYFSLEKGVRYFNEVYKLATHQN